MTDAPLMPSGHGGPMEEPDFTGVDDRFDATQPDVLPPRDIPAPTEVVDPSEGVETDAVREDGLPPLYEPHIQRADVRDN